MELVHGTNKPSQSASEEDDDVITKMPENVITNILDRLTIRDAVRTSILSRKWRLNWTLLTQLVFDDGFFNHLENFDWRVIISRLLIHLNGPITMFILYKLDDTELDVEDINHWIMFLSRKGIKDFTLMNCSRAEVKLPTHLFSCLELKRLETFNCCFYSVPSFRGFPNLLSLEIDMVADIDNFITKCPLLEFLKITGIVPVGKVKLVEMAKLKNLKVLSFPFSMLDDLAIASSTIFQLVDSLPKLQELHLNLQNCMFIEEAGVRKWVCTAFPCLKTLHLSNIDLSSSIMLSFAFQMIWASPNLQTLTIYSAFNEVRVPPPAVSFPEVDNNTKLRLQSVGFNCFRGLENEVYLIKTLLACSPLLHDMKICTKSSQVFGNDNGKLMFALKLLELNRASPIAKVKLNFQSF